MTPAGFPHSDIPGSKPVCGSPRLIAAYHVLHRLLVPRHPPCALSSLTGISKVHSLCITQRLVFDCQRAFVARLRRAIAPPPADSGLIKNAIQDLSWPVRAKANRPSLESGGDSGARTRSLRLAKPALSQLSYIPVGGGSGGASQTRSVGGPGWTRTTHLTLIRRAL